MSAKRAVTAAVVLAVCALGTGGVGVAAADPTDAPAPPAPATPGAPVAAGAPAAPAGPKTLIDHDGLYAVGTDIVPGNYASAGPVEGGVCYWKRVGGASGTDMVDNAMTKKPQLITIDAGDKQFKTSGCQPWTLTDQAPPPAQGLLPTLIAGAQLKGYVDDVNRRSAEAGQGQLPPG